MKDDHTTTTLEPEIVDLWGQESLDSIITRMSDEIEADIIKETPKHMNWDEPVPYDKFVGMASRAMAVEKILGAVINELAKIRRGGRAD